MGEILEVFLEGLAVVSPRLPVHTRRRFLLQREAGYTEREVWELTKECWKAFKTSASP